MERLPKLRDKETGDWGATRSRADHHPGDPKPKHTQYFLVYRNGKPVQNPFRAERLIGGSCPSNLIAS